MSEKGPFDDRYMQPIALAMQGMAVWYLVAGIAALGFVLVAALFGEDSSGDVELVGVSAVKTAEVTGGALAAALLLGGFSWAMQGRAFWRTRWSVILLPGLIGASASFAFDLMDWPVSYLVGGFAAFWMIKSHLESTVTPPSQSDS